MGRPDRDSERPLLLLLPFTAEARELLPATDTYARDEIFLAKNEECKSFCAVTIDGHAGPSSISPATDCPWGVPDLRARQPR